MDDTEHLGRVAEKVGAAWPGRSRRGQKECAGKVNPIKVLRGRSPGTEIGSRPDADPGEQPNHHCSEKRHVI